MVKYQRSDGSRGGSASVSSRLLRGGPLYDYETTLSSEFPLQPNGNGLDRIRGLSEFLFLLTRFGTPPEGRPESH